MTRPTLIVSAEAIVDRLFQFTDRHRQGRAHRRFVRLMVEGIVATRSTLVANIARWLGEDRPLIHTEQRLCRMLGQRSEMPWEELRERAVELACRCVGVDDVIAFDPGDLLKRYAEKMENLHPVHDGSTGEIGLGYEDISAEVIQWKDWEKQQIPLYHRLTSARCDDYRSQNHQIVRAIEEVCGHLGPSRGIWTFDRGHDRERILKKLLSLELRFIVRAMHNREVLVRRDGRWYPALLMQLARSLPLTTSTCRLTFPKVTHSQTRIGWARIRLPWDKTERDLRLVVIHDPRNKQPVVLITTLAVENDEQALQVFGYYLERWGKEEGYRFTKSWINVEQIRTTSWESIQHLAWLAHMAHLWIALTYRSAPRTIEAECERLLLNFRSIDEVRYRYYRVAHLMRAQLIEQRRPDAAAFATTEVA